MNNGLDQIEEARKRWQESVQSGGKLRHVSFTTVSGEPVEHAVTYHIGPRYPYKLVLLRTEPKG